MRILGFGRVPTTAAAEVLAPTRRVRMASPWSPGMSASIMAADWLGAEADLLPVTREQAMRVPAVVGARNLICTTLAQGVLEQYRGEAKVASQPSWLYRTDSDIPPQMRLLWTFDDLLFSGFSLWAVDRSSSGQIGDAMRVPPERWDFDEQFSVLVDQEPVNSREVLLFVGWDEGLLITGSDAIRQALDISATVSSRVRNPVPTTLLEEQVEQGRSDGTEDPDDNEVQDLLDGFAKARHNRATGAFVYVPYGITVKPYGEGDVGLFEQGRNAATLDIARLTGVPASLLEGTGVAASLTYETTEANRVILNDRLRARAQVVEARLSMDDASPRGSRVALNLSHLSGPETGLPASTED